MRCPLLIYCTDRLNPGHVSRWKERDFATGKSAPRHLSYFREGRFSVTREVEPGIVEE